MTVEVALEITELHVQISGAPEQRAVETLAPNRADQAFDERMRRQSLPEFAETASVFTFHNLAYQGVFESNWLPRLGLPWDQFSVNAMEFWGRISLLKGGIVNADVITTVSPTYAKEVQTPEIGMGFDGILRSRRDRVVGILNGIDIEEWDPARDRFLPQPFGATDLSGKRMAKRALLEKFALPVDETSMRRPVFGMASRLVDQKGFDLIAGAASDLISVEAIFVVLGTGEMEYKQFWRGLAAQHPDRVGVRIGFDEPLAHLIEAGSDSFLMPSRFEPCGLNQMYSLRYGTIPVVRAVGGLADTVDGDVGFRFHDYSVDAFLAVLREATRVYVQEPERWSKLIRQAMRRDHSWDRAAGDYVKAYELALTRHRV